MTAKADLTQKRLKVMAYYHKKILKFYRGSEKTLDLPHKNFDDLDSPKLILYDTSPAFIGRIEVNKEGISNFIHDTPLTFGCEEKCETLSMQDFVTCGRLPSLSTIRQSMDDSQDKKFYVYQTIAGKKSEKQEIFPLLRADTSKNSYLLRDHFNHLLKNEEKQIEIDLSENQAEFEWIMANEERFNDICNRLEIAMFKTPSKIMLTRYANADEDINL